MWKKGDEEMMKPSVKTISPIKARVWTVLNGKKIGRGAKRSVIYRKSENSGVIVDNGKSVTRDRYGEWYYTVTKK